MKTLIAIITMLLSHQLYAAEIPWGEIWEPGAAFVEEYGNKKATYGKYIYARNKGGTTLRAGQVVLRDVGSFTIASASLYTNLSATVPKLFGSSKNLSTERGQYTIVVGGEARPNPGVLTFAGLDLRGNAATAKITYTTGTTDVVVAKKLGARFSRLDSVYGDGVIDGTYTITAYCANGVAGNTGNDDITPLIAGIVVRSTTGAATVSDNSECILQVSGVALAEVTDTAVLPADFLGTDADDEGLDEVANSLLSKIVGIALEPCVTAGELIRVWLTLAN